MPKCISCKDTFEKLSNLQKCVFCDVTDIAAIKSNKIRCIECDDEFDPTTPAKRKAGGLYNQCVECSAETAVKYAGVASGDGKSSAISILSFEFESDKKKYLEFWAAQAGQNKPKACQLSSHTKTDPGVKFKTINKFIPSNHKGKAT